MDLKVPLRNRTDLALAYTPGVARVCMAIHENPADARNLTIKRNSVAVLTDGSAVLGLGNIGPKAAMPVMAVGAILGADHANTVLAAGRADLTAVARPHLADAYLTLHAAERYGHWDQRWPVQYLAAKPRPPRE